MAALVVLWTCRDLEPGELTLFLFFSLCIGGTLGMMVPATCVILGVLLVGGAVLGACGILAYLVTERRLKP